MDRKELENILERHKKWSRSEPDGEFADLRGANLRGENLWGAVLRDADLRHADLRGANLQTADLAGADLLGANLRGAILTLADLRYTSLETADLRDADLQGADLRGADLQGAKLCNADLRDADLRGADLRGADLRGANLARAYTDGMQTDAGTQIDWPLACPETGSFIAWKKVNGRIIKLEIPEDAARSSAATNKCRASKAKVLEIYNGNGTLSDITETMSSRCWIYKVGEMVYPDSWDDNRFNECSHGIHFFMTREEAVEW